jgi:hypothetical protein
MEELNQSVEAEAVDLSPLRLGVSFCPSDSRAPCLLAISSRVVHIDKVAEGRGLPTGEVESPKHARNVGVRGRRLLGSPFVKVRLGAEEASHLSPDPIFGCVQYDRWPKVQGGPFQKPRSVLFRELVEDCASP